MASRQQIPRHGHAQQRTEFPWAGQQGDLSAHPGYNMAYAPVINVQCVSSDNPRDKNREPNQHSTRRPKPSRPHRASSKGQSNQGRSPTSTGGQTISRKKKKNNLRAVNHHQSQNAHAPPRPCDHCGGAHWHRDCPRPFQTGHSHGHRHSMPLSSSPSTGHSSNPGIWSARDSTFMSGSTVSSSPGGRVVRPELRSLDGLLSSFRGFCCAVGNPTMADLQSTWVKLHRRRLEGTLMPPVRDEWNHLVRVATRERRLDGDGILWTMLLV